MKRNCKRVTANCSLRLPMKNLMLLARSLLDLLHLVVQPAKTFRFSSLFSTGDVLREGTSATQRQKFHTDDIKSLRNPVKSFDWLMEQLHCFSYCLRMTDKRPHAKRSQRRRARRNRCFRRLLVVLLHTFESQFVEPQPEKTANISQRHYWFPHEMTSEK